MLTKEEAEKFKFGDSLYLFMYDKNSSPTEIYHITPTFVSSSESAFLSYGETCKTSDKRVGFDIKGYTRNALLTDKDGNGNSYNFLNEKDAEEARKEALKDWRDQLMIKLGKALEELK